MDQSTRERSLWLTSFWGFSPESWGCIGFTEEWMRERFLEQAVESILVAIYVTKGLGPVEMRGRVIGLYEISRQKGHVNDFISDEQKKRIENNPSAHGKWIYSLKATRAWRIVPEDWRPVAEVFHFSYKPGLARIIAARCIKTTVEEARALFAMTMEEVEVFGQAPVVNRVMQPFENILKPSRAIRPPKEPYFVSETDGPKYLYVLRLEGDIASYLGVDADQVKGKYIVKVGFSKSPLSRRNQIQSAYPAGAFKWEVLWPSPIPENPPYPNADIAIAGEDAMKERLRLLKAKVLGGEFYLTDFNSIDIVWESGNKAADSKMGAIDLR